jgi:histone H3/H4
LKEIRHYQSAALADAAFFPRGAFAKVVKEAIEKAMYPGPRSASDPKRPIYHIQRDALIALQIATEQLFTNVFEMWYTP